MKYLDLLGHTVTDSVTGYKGVVECISYDLYGCIQLGVRPEINDKGEMQDARWIDAKRVIPASISEQPVMAVPSFEDDVQEDGPAEKPRR